MPFSSSTLPVAAAYIVIGAALAHVIHSDFFYYRIRNWSVLTVLAAWSVVAASYRFAGLPQDLLIAGLLFALAFGFWLLHLIGAGDAKLLGACGLAIGYDEAFDFAVLLLAFSVVFLVFLRLVIKASVLPIAISTRLIQIAEQRRVPYGVPIALAAMTIIGIRLVRLIQP